MHWPDVAAFLAMGGYAPFVWGSVAACGVAAVVEVAGVRARHARAVARARRRGADGDDDVDGLGDGWHLAARDAAGVPGQPVLPAAPDALAEPAASDVTEAAAR